MTQEVKATLTLDVSVEEAVLRVQYRLHNQDGHELVLFNRPFRYRLDGSLDLDPFQAYVFLDGETLVIEKRIPAVPVDLQVSEKVLPAVMRLPSGEEFFQELLLARPVVACHPYHKALAEIPADSGYDAVATAHKLATRISFQLGVARLTSPKHYKQLSAAYPDVGRLLRPGTMPQQVLVQELELVEPLDVLDYELVERKG